MKKLYTLFAGMIALGTTAAAQIDQTGFGSGYFEQSYYDIETGQTTSVDLLIWDLAFTVSGQGAAVLINEGVPSTMGAPLGEVQLYYVEGMNWTDTDTTGKQRLYNDESDWESGAFNATASPADPFDFGWGRYNPANHVVEGTRVYLLKTRDDQWKKIRILALSAGSYEFEIGDFDGSNSRTQTIDKQDFSGKTLAYYYIDTDEVLDLEPAEWDLMFTRYATPLLSGEDTLQYQVAGTLANAGVQIARASGVDPETVDYRTYLDQLSDDRHLIGHDWKYFDLARFEWSVPEDLVFFVKTADEKLWKLRFLDFEGSSTGVVTLEKTFLSDLTSSRNFHDNTSGMQLAPNPNAGVFTVKMERNMTGPAAVRVYDMLGRELYYAQYQTADGQREMNLELPLAPGHYQLVVSCAGSVFTESFILAKF